MATAATKSQVTRDPVRRWTLIVLGLIVVLFVYSIIADRMTPYTSQATVQTFVVRMAPEVAGRVMEVNAIDNQRVKGGDVLFRIGPQSFTIALQEADARLAGVGQSIGASTAAVSSAQERLVTAQAKRDNTREQVARIFQLVEKGVYAKARADQATAQSQAAEAGVREAEAELERAKQELGPQGTDNPQFREALAAVEQAKLDLLRTTVLAPSDGVVTNLQLTEGEFVAVGQAAMTFIDTSDAWINANFRENSLGNVKAGDPVELVLDTLPGRVFKAEVQSVGWGVSQGSIDPETGLPKINEPMGLVRTPQRFAVKIEPNREDYVPGSVRYGSQANVIVYATDNAVVNAIGKLWIRLVAILTYVS
ncbi:MAG TPA: HlyD family secretion protein [Methyloceanibacter sp.]|nr:HlyD family secretion protein [Methyloceanibacter sp.]